VVAAKRLKNLSVGLNSIQFNAKLFELRLSKNGTSTGHPSARLVKKSKQRIAYYRDNNFPIKSSHTHFKIPTCFLLHRVLALITLKNHMMLTKMSLQFRVISVATPKASWCVLT